MIKTALTVNISSKDILHNSYLVNGTQLGLLSSASQNIFIQTSHRPIQYMTVIKASDPQDPQVMARHRQELNRWLNFMPVLQRRGCQEQNSLLQQYHLEPDLMVCLDQFRLQAWIPGNIAFYLLRGGELRRLKPVPLRDLVFDQEYHDHHHYYALQINPEDFYLLLPPELPAFFANGELAGVLSGLRQLPAKISELMQTARQRGFQEEATWMAVEVIRLDEDQQLPSDVGGLRRMVAGWSTRRAAADEDERQDSASETLSPDEPDRSRIQTRPPLWPITRANWPAWAALAAVLAAVVLLILLTLGGGGSARPTDSSQETTLTTTAAPATATPRPTATPTVTPAPTQAPVTLVVTANKLNLRETPDRNGKLLDTLDKGDRLEKLAEPEGEWVRVRTDDGQTGYVYYPYVSDESQDETTGD